MKVKNRQVMIELCPRCELRFFLPYGQGEGMGDLIRAGALPAFPALSRAARDEEDAPIYVCATCGQSEGMLQYTTGRVIPPEEWPISRAWSA